MRRKIGKRETGLTVSEWRTAIAKIPEVARSENEAEHLRRTFLALAEEQHPFEFGANIVRLPLDASPRKSSP